MTRHDHAPPWFMAALSARADVTLIRHRMIYFSERRKLLAAGCSPETVRFYDRDRGCQNSPAKRPTGKPAGWPRQRRALAEVAVRRTTGEALPEPARGAAGWAFTHSRDCRRSQQKAK